MKTTLPFLDEIDINVLYDLYSSLDEETNNVVGILANEYKNVTEG
jgi:hypothetical protein